MSDRLIVIGLTGPAGSGKDTAAGILCALHGFHRIALADGVKAAFDDLSGPTRALHKDLSDAFTQRKAWQYLGTESRNAVNSRMLWSRLLAAKIHYAAFLHPKPILRFVIPDVSFPHEITDLNWLIEGNFEGHYETWRIDRPGLAPIEDQHSSEEGRRTIPADRTISNHGGMDWLAESVGGRLAGMLDGIDEPHAV